MEGREAVLGEIKRLARSRVNDAVQLAFLKEEHLGELEGLELSAVTEFKRSGNGAVELKFIDRVAVLQWLAEQEKDERPERVFGSLEEQAKRLREDE